jgi:MinD-like ATPase involved in chromosome partitioning or flagellar assembly
LKSALYRKLSREFAKDDEVMQLLYQPGDDNGEGEPQSLPELLAYFKAAGSEQYERLSRSLWNFQLFLLVNMVKSKADLKSPEIIQSVCTDFLGIHPEILGHLVYDPAVEAAVNQMVPFPLGQKKSPAAQELEEMARRIVKESRLPKGGWTTSQIPEEAEMPPGPLSAYPLS